MKNIAVPSGSMCLIGLKLSRPARLAVGSPSLYATKPCASSWTIMRQDKDRAPE